MNKNLVFYVSNVSQLGLRFVQMIVITRCLTNVDLGLYYAAAAYPQLLSRIIDLGLPHAVRYFMLQFPGNGRFILKMIFSYFSLAFVPVLIFFYFIGILPLESSDILQVMQHDFFILSVYCILLTANTVILSVVVSFEKFFAILFSSTVPYIISVALILLQYYYHTLDVHDVLLQILISEGVIMIIYLSFILSHNPQASPDQSLTVRTVLRYALQIYPSGFLKVMTTRLDKVILSFIAPPVFIGYYSVLMTIRDISIFPITTYGQVFMNRLSKAFKSKDATINKEINQSLVVILIIFSIGFGVYWLIQDFVLQFFFKQVTPGIRYVSFYLLLSIIPLALFAHLSNVFLASNRPRFISYSSIVSIVMFYGFIFLFLSRLNADSFIYASLISTTSGFIYLFAVYRGLLKKENL